MKKILQISAITILSIFLILVGLYTLMNSTTFQISGEIINRIDTDKKVVALTFDDGPNEHTDEILQVMEDKQVRGTFYLVGNQMENNLEEAKKIQAAGHQIGNHSYTHSRMVFKTPQFVRSEIEQTNALIRKTGYAGEITFRPPYGKKLITLPLYLSQQNIKTIMWDLDPLQTLPDTATSQEITDFVVQQATAGSIILIHPWYGEENNSRAAIPAIIDALKSAGYEFVTVNELVGV